MGVSVRLTRNTRVYLPFWVAIPAWLIAGAIWLMVLVVIALGWLLIVLPGKAIAASRANRSAGERRQARQPRPADSAQLSSDHPSHPPRIERTSMTGSPSSGGQPTPPQPPRKSWPARHKAWTAIIGVVGILVVLGVIGTIAGPPKGQPTAGVGTIPASISSSATPSPTPSPPALTSTASVTRQHPLTGTKVGVQVSTAPGARITVVAHFEAGDRTKTARADSTGVHTFWFPLGGVPPGIRVMVDVRVFAHGQKRSTRVWFTPRQPAPSPIPTSAPPPPPSGCYPKTSSGHCYEPGEFCPQADAGMRGVAGDGEAIICENNNGLRWEPA